MTIKANNNDELEKIKKRYEKRASNEKEIIARESGYVNYIVEEREKIYERLINEHFKDLNKIKVLEIGAGKGGNLNFFKRIGIPEENIFANELLPERSSHLKKFIPEKNIIYGNACDISSDLQFDIVFQSLVFTSILDSDFKTNLADKLFSITKKGGIILWYDFKFNNPNNKDVKGVDKEEIKKLFPASKSISFFSVTLAPPIARRVGKLYSFINSLFPFLRTHIIALIKK